LKDQTGHYFFIRRQLACLILQHDGDVVADRESQLAGFADQFLFGLAVFEVALANRADEDIKQPGVHGVSPE
jgi:uncharacterized protein YgfB (UPF0149 family)